MSFEGTDVWKYSEKLVKLIRPISVSMWKYSYQIYKWKLVKKVKIKVSSQQNYSPNQCKDSYKIQDHYLW